MNLANKCNVIISALCEHHAQLNPQIVAYGIIHPVYNNTYIKPECGPMPNLMVALPNIGGTLCSTPQSLANTHYLIAVQ